MTNRITKKMMAWVYLNELINGKLQNKNELYTSSFEEKNYVPVNTTDFITIECNKGMFRGGKATLQYDSITAETIRWHIKQIEDYKSQ